MADSTWQRTTKDGTRYRYNAQGLMVAATDRQGNATQHIYNALGQIQQIIDPVGLITTFNYTGNRVTSIVDPAARTTILSYDGQGNLVSVTDPDGTKNQYGYDNRHLLSSSIDKIGQVRTGTYDEFGRAKTATREDGTTVQIKPVEAQGLLNKQQTTNLNQIAVAAYLPKTPTSTYVDGNGHVTQTSVNNRGQVVSQGDEIGTNVTNTYGRDRLVTSTTDAQGYVTEYDYDRSGNVIGVRERVDANIINLEGNIKTPTSISIPAPGSSKVLTTGDINNDGYVDLVTTGYNGKLNVLFGDITGSFTNTNIIDISAYTRSNSIDQLELKDVNNDGKLDLIANLPNDGLTTYIPGNGGGYGYGYGYGYGGGTVAVVTPLNPILVFLNQGNGQFINSAVPALAARSAGFVTGDFNGDGQLDILVRSNFYSNQNNSAAPLTLYAGDGTGIFTQQPITIPGIDHSSQFTSSDSQIVAGDFNGDGKTDLVINLYDRLSLYSYDNNGIWSELYRDTSDFNTYRSRFTIGDLNNDGKLDIVTASTTKIELLLAQNNGSFQSRIFNRASGGYYPKNLNIADVNGDLQSDLVVIDSNNLVETYSLDRDLQLSQLRVPIQIQSSNGYLGITDIDRNGSLDLLWDSSYSTIGVVKDYYKSLEHATTYISSGENVTKSYFYNAKFNQLGAVIDELGHITLYSLDTNTGNVLKTTRVVGQLDSVSNGETNDVITSYTYTTSGQVDTVTDALLHLTDYDYDTYGNLVKTTAAKDTTDQTVEEYRYDLAGNRTASFDALGRETKYIYNNMNMLLQTINANGGATTYNYDKMGHQTKVTDALGRVTSMTYDSRGRLVSTIDAEEGGINTNSYDNNGNLVSVKDALGRASLYQYDARNRLIGTTAADGGISSSTFDLKDNLIGNTDSLGNKTQKFYDSRNRLSREVDAVGNETKYGYDAANQLTSITDAMGNLTVYQYDELGRQTAQFRALTTSTSGLTTNASGYATRTEYDKLGNVTATIDENGNRTEYKYDALNRRIQVKDAQNALTKTTYDKVGNILSVTDALNRNSSFNYDALDRLIKTTDALNHDATISYDRVGNILSTTDALNHTTSFSYDNLDRLIKTTDALGQDATISYDRVGNVRSKTDELGRTTYYGYDLVDRLISTLDPLSHTTSTVYDTEGNIKSTTDALAHTTIYKYDRNNRLISTKDALNQEQTIGYDEMGNIIARTNELGQTTTYTYDALDRQTAITDALGHATTYTYDAVGNRTQVADALGQTTKFVYDSLNRQIRVIDAKGGVTRTGYDAVGNIRSITDAVGNITSYTYDALDRQITDTNSLGKTRSYGYDAVGDLISSVDRNGRKRTYDYDALNRQTAENWLDNVGNNIRTFTYGYDAVGHLLGTNDPDSKYTYTYDAVDRLKSVDNLGTSGVPNVLLNYSYDAVGNLLSVTDRINGVLAGTNAYSYDVLNRATRITQSGTGVQSKRVDMSYDAVNRLTGLNRYGDLAGTLAVADSSSSYDAAGRLKNLTHKRGASAIAGYGFAYDNANRITQSSGTDGTQDYSYDDTNQLTAVDHTTQADEAYSYDANGNRTNAGYGTGTDNRLLTDGVYNYTYDDEGNRTKRTEIATGKITEYVWDYRDRLTSVTFKDAAGNVTKTIAYTYDVNDRRIGKKIDGVVTERYVYDGSNIALVFDGSGTQTHRYLYGTGVDTVLANERGGTVVWALADNQGTIRDLVDGGGVILNHVNYDSFGRMVSQTNPSVEFRFGYTGREQDGETGLDYYRARYYDAGNGRFISEDPLGFGAGDGNLTRYVGNSPVNFIDPSGYKGVPTTPVKVLAPVKVPLPKRSPFPGSPSFSPLKILLDVILQELLNPAPAIAPAPPKVDPDIPNPNKCAIFEQYTSKLEEKIVAQGNTTENKKCKYAYIIPADTLSRGSQYARYVSRSVYELGVVDLQTGNIAIYDGITPNTTNVWEAKSYLESEAIRVRSVHQRSFGGIRNFNDAEKKIYNKSIPRLPEQANRSVEVAEKCGFNLNYAVNSKNLKQFVQEDLQNFPRRGIEKFPKINVLYKPMPGIENIQ